MKRKSKKTAKELEELKAVKQQMRIIRLWIEDTTMRQELKWCIDKKPDVWPECVVLEKYLDAGDYEHALLAAFWLGSSVGADEATAAFRRDVLHAYSLKKGQKNRDEKRKVNSNTKASKAREAVEMLMREGKGITEAQEIVANRLGLKGIRQVQRYCKDM